MSFGFRTKEKPSLRDRFRGKSSDQILEELRKKIDQDKEMFFDRVPNAPSFRRAGFPFDDDGLVSRSRPDFRHRLEELAQQHPEFADSLRPWYSDAPPSNDMGWTFRQRTGSGSNGPSPQSDQAPTAQQPPQSDSKGNKEVQQPEEPQPSEVSSRGIPQHGLRNTVDIGEAQQAHAQMESQDTAQEERGKRAQSAPPDNPSKEPQRFVSRLEISPAPEQATTQDNSTPTSKQGPSNQQPTQSSKPSSNVRQIPIFVEGRDEPVLAKHDVDTAAPNFNQPFGHHSFSSQGFSRPGNIHDNLRFGEAPRYTSSMHHHFNPSEPQAQKRPFPHQHQQPPPSRHPSRQEMKEAATPQQQPSREGTPPPAPKQVAKPKDALVTVQEVQKEVQALAEQVDAFEGQRQDKQYLYLDEMLTRNLIKLDVIETEGRDDVRAARKETIRAIQQCISKLESKVTTPEELEAKQKAEFAMETDDQPQTTSGQSTEAMEAEPSHNSEVKTEPTVDLIEGCAQLKSSNSADPAIDAPMEAPVPKSVAELPQENPSSSISLQTPSLPKSDDSVQQQLMDVTAMNSVPASTTTSAPES